MIPNNFKCPSCGHNKIETSVQTYSLEIPFGDTEYFDMDYYICPKCEFESTYREGDPFGDAREKGLGNSIEKMINNLRLNGLNQAYIEHVLELPSRTLSVWKKGKISKGAVALLRAINTFPEILDIAQFNWSEEGIKKVKAKSAANYMENFTSEIKSKMAHHIIKEPIVVQIPETSPHDVLTVPAFDTIETVISNGSFWIDCTGKVGALTESISKGKAWDISSPIEGHLPLQNAILTINAERSSEGIDLELNEKMCLGWPN